MRTTKELKTKQAAILESYDSLVVFDDGSPNLKFIGDYGMLLALVSQVKTNIHLIEEARRLGKISDPEISNDA